MRLPNPAEADAFRRALEELPCGAVDLAIVDLVLTPGVRGLWRACILLPDGISNELSIEELQTVMAHELAHVRRRDNLLALVTHIIVGAFWFHPLVWWLERRMLLERETACDEMVLAGGVAADVYAAGILRVCRRSLNLSGAYAAFTGPNLIQRMEHIMSAESRSSRSLISRVALYALIAFTLLTPVGAGFLAAQPRPVPPPAPQAQPAPPGIMFEVEALVNQGNADEAIALLQNEIDRSPNRQDLQIALGNVAVRMKRYDLAIATFQKLLDSTGSDSKTAADLSLRLGETYRRMGDLNLAMKSLRSAKESAPASPAIISTLALTLDGLGLTEEAQREYEAALVLAPDNAVVMNNLAFLLSQHNGDLDRAIALAERARGLLPANANVIDTIGWIQLKRNLAGNAIAAFNQAIEAEPSNPSFHYHLGMAWAAKGDAERAAAALKTALTLEPSASDRDGIRQLLDRLQR